MLLFALIVFFFHIPIHVAAVGNYERDWLSNILLLKKLIEHFHFCDNVPQTQVM